MDHTASTTIGLSDEEVDLLLGLVKDLRDGTDRLPDGFSIRLIDRADWPEYVDYAAEHYACPLSYERESGLWFELEQAGSLPEPLASRIDALCETYQDWRTGTVIRENFSADTLTFRLLVRFDDTATAADCQLTVSYHFYGIPADSVPPLEEILEGSSPQKPLQPRPNTEPASTTTDELATD